MKPVNWDGLLERLEAAEDFPTLYTFRFIVAKPGIDQLRRALESQEMLGPLSEAASESGRHIRVRASGTFPTADSIVQVYKSLVGIRGLISL